MGTPRLPEADRFDMLVHAVVAMTFLVVTVVLAWLDHLDSSTVTAAGMASFALLTGSDALSSWRQKQ